MKVKENSKIEFNHLIDIDDLRLVCVSEIIEIFSPVEIAKQLTVIDWELFNQIKPYGLLKRAWDKDSLKHRALPIIRCLKRLDAVSHWVASTIIIYSTPTQRADAIRRFLAICEVHFHSFFLSVSNL